MSRMSWVLIGSAGCFSNAGIAALAAPEHAATPATEVLKYPQTDRGDTVDVYHGEKIADPYRWLEDDRAESTAQWVKAQNDVTQAYLGQIPQREEIRSRLTEIWNYERFGVPERKAGKYFFTRNTGLQPQSVLYVAKSLDDPGTVLLDPNTLKADGTAALSGRSLSHDGSLMAYGVADSGSDWQIWRVRDVSTGKDLPDEIRWVKFSSMSWTRDNSGFVYTRFEEPSKDKVLTGINENPSIYFHKIGTPQSQDIRLYTRPDQPRWSLGAGISDDGRYLLLYTSEGSSPQNKLHVRDLSTHPLDWQPGEADQKIAEHDRLAAQHGSGSDAARAQHYAKRAQIVADNGGLEFGFREIAGTFESRMDVIDNEGSTLYVWSDEGAPRGKVIAIDLADPVKSKWRTIIPEAPEAMTSTARVGPRLVIEYLKDAASVVRLFDLEGRPQKELELPGLGSVSGIQTDRDSTSAFYAFTSYTRPTTIFEFDAVSGEQHVFKQAKVKFDPDRFVTDRVMYKSFDGTPIPMFITRRKDTPLDGTARCILYGYGGFNIAQSPGFSPVTTAWVERGGIFAVACIRGGGEYGKAWHEAAIKIHRPVAFKDFIMAADFLVNRRFTSPSLLAIRGGSNGGLLVGACMTQRPEMFGAAIPEVGVMDMLRFHLFTIGYAWKTDYGSSENPEEYRVLRDYSPYHALLRASAGTTFPATLVTTADHDDRVVPGHSFKFAAALQTVGSPTGVVDPAKPLLIRVETSAGHGAGKPTQKAIDQNTDILAFLEHVLKPSTAAKSAGPKP